MTSAIGWDNWPTDGWTTDDLDALPEDGRRRELIDGALLLSPSPAFAHQTVARRLANALDEQCPTDHCVVEAVEVRINARRALIPDVLVITREAAERNPHQVNPNEVPLVVEIVSKGSTTMDRVTKPNLYALARIPFYWRIEIEHVLTVHTFTLDGGTYRATGEHTDRLVTGDPWPIDLDLGVLLPRFWQPAR